MACKSSDDESNSSDALSLLSEEWLELCKSDYAKVIFSDMFHNAQCDTVGCKFQITDNVHEDPCDYIGLFKIGFDDLSQCLASKMLSETRCEDDGKLISCVFKISELPRLENGFFQFLYVTCDKEVCGASMPFEVTQLANSRSLSTAEIKDEPIEGDFVFVQRYEEEVIDEVAVEPCYSELDSLSRIQNEPLDHQLVSEEYIKKCFSEGTRVDEKELISSLNQSIKVLEINTLSLQEENCSLSKTISEIREEKCALQTKNETLEQQNISVTEKFEKMSDAFERQVKVYKDVISESERYKLLQLETVKEKEALSQDNKICYKELKEVVLENIKIKKLLQESKEWLSTDNTESLMEQIDHQKCMIQALQDSKQMVLKELSCRLEELNQSIEDKNDIIAAQQEQLQTATETENDLKDTVECLQQEISNLRSNEEFVIAETETSDKAVSCAEVSSEEAILQNLQSKAKDLNELVELAAASVNFSDPESSSVFFDSKITLLVALSKMRKPDETICQKSTTRAASENAESNVKWKRADITDCEKHDVEEDLSEETSSTCTTSDDDSTERQVPEVKENEDITKRKFKYVTFPEKEPEDAGSSTPEEGEATIEIEFQNRKCLELMALLKVFLPLEPAEVELVTRLHERREKRAPSFKLPEFDVPESFIIDSESSCSAGTNSKTSMDADLQTMEHITSLFLEMLRVTPCMQPAFSLICESFDSLPLKDGMEILLSECTNEYRVELLLEFIEKQTERAQKVSDEIRSLLARWKGEVCEMKKKHEHLESAIAEKDDQLAKLAEKCAKQAAAVEFLSKEKSNWLSREVHLQEMVNEHAARLHEAGELYKKQYIEIEKMKKKMKSSKRSKLKKRYSGSSSEENDSCYVKVGSSHARNASDSDTGEHVLSCSTAAHRENVSSKENVCTGARPKSAIQTSGKLATSANACAYIPSITVTSQASGDESSLSIIDETKSHDTAEPPKDFFRNMLEKMSQHASDSSSSADGSRARCEHCGEAFDLNPRSFTTFLDHMKEKHDIFVCPVCGHPFEPPVPLKYVRIHLEEHFE